MTRKNSGFGTIILIIVLAIILFFIFRNNDSPNTHSNENYYGNYYEQETYYEIFNANTVRACQTSTMNCYTLDIDFFSDNTYATIYFPNGGYRELYLYECQNYWCFGEDDNGTEWELAL